MKKLLLSTSMLLMLIVSCKKETEVTPETTNNTNPIGGLIVEKKNMPLIAKYTNTGCGVCGSTAWNKMKNIETEFGNKAVYANFYQGSIQGKPYDALKAHFGYPLGYPNWIINYNSSGSSFSLTNSERNSIEVHLNAKVIANSNYEKPTFEYNGVLVKVKTRTTFFENVSGEYYLIPYMLIDNISQTQMGHPNYPAKVNHMHWIKGVAQPLGEVVDGVPPQYLGYKIAEGNIQAGHTIDREWEIENTATGCKESDIHFALVIVKKVNGKLQFVNAFTK